MQTNEAIKVFFIARSMRGGGAERIVTVLLRHIDRRRFVPTLCLVEKMGPFLEDLPEDIEIIDLGARRLITALPKLVSLLRDRRPELVFSSIGYISLGVALCRPFIPRDTKIIGRETNIPSINTLQSPFPVLLRFLYRWLYPTLDKVVCQSNDMMNDLLTNFVFPAEKTVVINNPVDVGLIRMCAEGLAGCFPENKVALLAVGKLTYQKGFDLLLKAVALLKDENFHLAILGEGPQKGELNQLIDKLGLRERVRLKGFINNPYPHMKSADLLVLSSRFEGFPNVVLESLACGTPVVAFDCPGDIGEIIEDGVNGYRVEAENERALAHSIVKALRVDWDRELIKRRIEEKFGVRRILSEYERIFEEVFGIVGR